MKAMAVLGPAIFSLRSVDFIAQGHMGDLEVRIIETAAGCDYGSWQEAYELGIASNDSRNRQIVNAAETSLAAGKRVMILVKHINHGKALEAMLKTPAAFLCGTDASMVRGDLKEDFNKHGDFVLIASPIFDEGVDLPEITVLINASGGKSEWKTIQKVGRGLHKKSSGKKLVVYDFADHGKFLEKHSYERIAIYEREGFTVIREEVENAVGERQGEAK
jgi:superfamily II DNA or RNA helicase